jgi:hypothetical protein
MTYDLNVEVADGKAKATLNIDEEVKDADQGTASIDTDPLRLETVRLLQQWLGRWQLVSEIGSDYKDFPVLETFRVLGEHLYQMVFRGEVANAFKNTYDKAEAAGQPLRVMLSFAEDSTELAALPWEFLYRRADSGPSFYLATETHLLLNRCLPTGRTKMPVTDLPLRVLFIMCLIQSDDPEQREQMELRDEILRSIRQLEEQQPTQLDISIVENWDVDSVEAALKNDPHVVHIVGHAQHARDASGRMIGVILLPGPDGTLQWNEPHTVAELLTRSKSREQFPRLVILHLCEAKPINFTASFERLAPELIKTGILAVLAMQYPLSASAARKFTGKFYRRLAAGHEIDLIVQETRYEMYSRLQDNRLIGTPVLYMQSLGGQLVAQQAVVPSKGKTDPHHVSTRSTADGSIGMRQRLRAAAWSQSTDVELARELDGWIQTSEWSDDPAQNGQQIRDQMTRDAYIGDRGPMYMAMLKELKRGSR